MKAIEKIRKINDTFPDTEYIKEWKAQGKKIVGWLCNYVPEELIHAAGILPVRVTGYHDSHNMRDGTVKLSTSLCSFTRSCLQIMLDKELNFMDGFICGNCCDGTRRFSEVVILEGFENLKLHMVNPPFKITDASIELYKIELLNTKKWLEDAFEVTITDEDISESIKVYNTTRRLVRKLNGLRKLDNPPITGTEVMEVMNAGYCIPKEEFNKILEQLIEELEDTNQSVKDGYRLMVIGTPMTNPGFFSMLEESGSVVVSEEMCTGSRYYWELVDDNSNPMDALAARYLSNFPCARMIPSTNRMDMLLELAREWKVEGIVSANIPFCAFYGSDVPMLRNLLKEEGIPMLELTMEYNEGATEQSKTRIQAFFEMIESKGVVM